MSRFMLIPTIILLAGCATVQFNDGKTVSIQADGWYGLDSLQNTADKACQQYGKSHARYLHSANMNPHLPIGSGVQNTMWECSE
ncbi:hypothetical protein R9X49_20395 [Pectobacterium carotovorum]|uniref:hypothetical protein n=1 Tax=Pectobacterium carotovorum TaxID=554 RepID=UPI0029D6B8E2|nr:hypothetical protein [Pectobacterium carotovorum]MDX6917472.1 hypothetical protein [Pectobacterium carotovorum]